jgi:hypothetical protein
MSMHAAITLMLVQGSDGLTAGEILTGIPTSPAALVVYALVIGASFLIWKYGRSGGGSGRKPTS